MKIVLGENNYKTKQFASRINGIVASEMCGIKFVKEEVEVYIPYAKITENGMIEKTNLFIDEVLITLNIKNIYYGNQITNSLLETMKFYNTKITQL